ncbi:MAG: hypothetical protein R2881_04080 [Eubacteriales bacterium]
MQRGEIHALMGENGAGEHADEDALQARATSEGDPRQRRKVSLNSPTTAIAHGIGMVHPALHARAERNQSRRTSCSAWCRRRAACSSTIKSDGADARECAEKFNLAVNPDAKSWTFPSA